MLMRLNTTTLMRLTPKTNLESMIYQWDSTGLLSVAGYGYVRQFQRELLLLIYGKYFVMELSDITMKNLLISDNYCNELILIYSRILLQLTSGIWKKMYLSLMRLIMERHFLLALP